MDEINVEKIMSEVRASIPEGESWGDVDFEDIPIQDAGEVWSGDAGESLERSLSAARESAVVTFYRPIPGSGVKVFFKRVVRKLIRFCVEPITERVTLFHRNALRVMATLRRSLLEQRWEQQSQRQELDALRERLTALEEELEKERP